MFLDNLRDFSWFGRWVPILLGVCFAIAPARSEPAANAGEVEVLTLNDYLHQVLQHNESLQAQMLNTEVTRHVARSEWGAFEPQLKTSVTRQANKRLNNSQQLAASGGVTLFREQNTIYNGELETLIPTGGKIKLGATMSDLANNVNPTNIFGGSLNYLNYQYQTFVGVTFIQPLLKNGGFTPTLASLRLASLKSAIAFQKYRRQLMLMLSRAEAAYWNLYFAQEQMRFFEDSVAVARTVLADSRQKLKAGQASELDVMQAKSALALRETKRNDARQSYFSAVASLESLTGTAPIPNLAGSSGPTFRVVDTPPQTNALVSYPEAFQEAFQFNPDYLIQAEKMRQERLRLGVARGGVKSSV